MMFGSGVIGYSMSPLQKLIATLALLRLAFPLVLCVPAGA
jgi:hypothetical protein